MKRIFVSLFCIAAMACTATAVDGVIAVPTRDKGQAVYVNDARVYPTGTILRTTIISNCAILVRL